MKTLFVLASYLLLTSTTYAKAFPVTYEEISTVRMMNHSNVPIKVLVYRQKSLSGFFYNNTKFVSELARIIADINIEDNLSYREKLKLVILDSTNDGLDNLPLDDAEKQQYITHVPFKGDRWLQDFGEIMVASTADDPQEKLLLFDVNRGRGLRDLPSMLANFWSGYYFKIDDRSMTGNYGGNLEATPNNVHYVGNTSSTKMQNFFKDHGQAENLLVLNTSWLQVGHIDEYTSTIITDDACGFAIVKASPAKAMQLLRDAGSESFDSFPAAYDSQKYAQDFQAMQKLLQDGSVLEADFTASTTMEKHLVRQAKIIDIINNNVDQLIKKIQSKSPQCANIKVVEFPILFKCSTSDAPSRCHAWLPGTANMLVLRDHLIIPDPFFTPFKNAIKEQADAFKQKVHFVDDMFYHKGIGEIHCGTNVFRLPNERFVKN